MSGAIMSVESTRNPVRIIARCPFAGGPSPVAKQLLPKRTDPGALLVGAAIGAGSTARGAVLGGADMLLAISAGRLRMMGTSSLASVLPIVDTNRFVSTFAIAEILQTSPVPVFFGASAMDPDLDLSSLVSQIARWGFAGIVNFPSVIHLDRRRRDALESIGRGLAREVEMLALARTAGLSAVGYVQGATGALAMIDAGIDIINLNFGWNQGGMAGVEGSASLDEVSGHAREVFRSARRANPDVVCFIEGGPVITAEDVFEVSRTSRADGYIGGSTIDRLALESSVPEKTSSFKTIHLMRPDIERAERRSESFRNRNALQGWSQAIRAVADEVRRIAKLNVPVAVVGERGTGKQSLARALHASSHRASQPLYVLDCREHDQQRLIDEIFGAEPRAPLERRRIGLLEIADGATIVLTAIAQDNDELAGRIAEVAASGRFMRANERLLRNSDARLIVSMTQSIEDPRGALDLAARFKCAVIALPPLRERLEDIPSLVGSIIGRIAGKTKPLPGLENDALTKLLRHRWPGNIAELRSVIERAVVLADSGKISDAHIRFEDAEPDQAPLSRPLSEREWLVDGLKRNRFRRAETARFLGISRKTLYNKIVKYNLFE